MRATQTPEHSVAVEEMLVARILNISENTAIRHFHSATRKLDSASKHQAVLKALRTGIIT